MSAMTCIWSEADKIGYARRVCRGERQRTAAASSTSGPTSKKTACAREREYREAPPGVDELGDGRELTCCWLTEPRRARFVAADRCI